MTPRRRYNSACERLHAFDVANELLYRIRVVECRERSQGGNAHILLLITIHHMIADGWSLGILLRDWSLMYRGLLEKRAISAGVACLVCRRCRWQRKMQAALDGSRS